MHPEQRDGFRQLTLEAWRQFDSVTLDFHPRLTVLTGANASGKSTILGLLARHFNWNRAYSSSPLGRGRGRWSALARARREEQGAWTSIGSLTYASEVTTEINVPMVDPENRAQYDLNLPAQQPVTGVFLTSHRVITGNYSAVSTIPALFGSSDQMFEQFTNEIRMRWLGSRSQKTPQLALKEALIAAAVFGGGGNESVETNEEAAAVWTGFQQVLGQILPDSLGFHRLRVRVPEVIVETATGEFILDDVSGGVSAIIEVAWQIFLRSRNHTSFTVLLDEPENHLHPRLQREILPSLLRAFPHVQFIVATHSPFVVTATPDSGVYVLDYNARNRVQSRLLDYGNKAASAEDTLKRVLGLESTMPMWAERQFDAIVDRYLTGTMDPDRLAAMRAELAMNGLETEFPQAVTEISDGRPGDA